MSASDIGPASCADALHVAPPLGEETKPTLSWQVAGVQVAFG
jgi:hypothetical protein